MAAGSGKKRAFGYVRVSTEEQAAEGISLRAQRSRIRAHAKALGLKLEKIYADEGISGRSLERPELQKLLGRVKGKAGETVMVYRLSRLSRSTRDLLFLVEEAFVEGNTRLVSVSEHIDTESPMGRLFLTIMAALAQMERELISERTRAVLQFKKEQGEFLGSPPFGYRIGKDNTLVTVAAEMKVVRQILRWRKKGLSYAKIATALNEKGSKTKRGGKWYPSTVRNVALHPEHTKKS